MTYPTNVAMVPCDFCGMPCTPNEYHPYAACLMFKACHNSGTVRANLDAVRAQPAPAPTADATVDTFRLDWLEANSAECVFHLGTTWYIRASYGQPYRKCSNLRAAIDAAIAAQREVKA